MKNPSTNRGIETTLNAEQHTLDVEHIEPVSSVVSKVTGQTIHRGCGSQGSCGSCTIIVKGKPRMSCTMRAKNIHNKIVTTTAGIPTEFKEKLKVRLIQEGATQCGYCIPALTTQLYNLCAHIDKPSDEQIQKALSTHSCRCMAPQVFIEAIVSFINDTAAGDGWIPEKAKQSLCDHTGTLSDLDAPNMLYARPIIGQSVSADASLQHLLVLAHDHPEVSLFNDPTLLGFIVTTEEWRLDAVEKAINITPIEHRAVHSTSDIMFAAVDPAPMETEICTVIKDVIHVNGLERLPNGIPSRCRVKQWNSGGSFGHRRWNAHVEWALWLQEKYNTAISVRMTMAQMLHLRSKQPNVGVTVDEESDTIILSTGNTEGLSIWRQDLTKYTQRLLDSPLFPQYNVSVRTCLTSDIPQQYSYTRILQVGACLLGLLWRLNTDNHDYAEQLQWAEQARIQMKLPPTWMNIINRHRTFLLDNPERTFGWGICTTESYTSSIKTPLMCEIIVESPTNVVVASPLFQTDGYTISLMLHHVHTQTNIPLKHLQHRTSGQYPDEAMDPDLMRIHCLDALDTCIEELKNSLEGSTIDTLVHRNFSTVQTKTTIPANGCSVLVEINERGDVLNSYIGMDCGQTHSLKQIRSILSGRWMRTLGREQLWDRHGNRSVLFKDLRTMKAKDRVTLHVDLEQSKCMLLPLCTVDGATTAAIIDARSKMGLSTRHFPFVKN